MTGNRSKDSKNSRNKNQDEPLIKNDTSPVPYLESVEPSPLLQTMPQSMLTQPDNLAYGFWGKIRNFLESKVRKLLNALNLFALTVAIAALVYENLVSAIPYIFPGISIPLPPWFASNVLVPAFGALAITESINAIISLFQFIFVIKASDKKLTDVFSALFAFLGSAAACVGASLIAFGVAINPLVIPSIFITALTSMALGVIFDYIAKYNEKVKNNTNVGTTKLQKMDPSDTVKLGLTIGLSVCGVIALAVKLASIATAGALITIPVSWVLAGILALVVIVFIISKLVGKNKTPSHSDGNTPTGSLLFDNDKQSTFFDSPTNTAQTRKTVITSVVDPCLTCFCNYYNDLENKGKDRNENYNLAIELRKSQELDNIIKLFNTPLGNSTEMLKIINDSPFLQGMKDKFPSNISSVVLESRLSVLKDFLLEKSVIYVNELPTTPQLLSL
jgi:hypothetical protein